MSCSKPPCGCDCAEGNRILLDDDDAHLYTSRCQCTLCGEDSIGCTVLVEGSVAKMWWFIIRHRGRSATPFSHDELGDIPIFCEDCFEHALSLTMHNASGKFSGKRKRVHEDDVHDAETDSSTTANTR